MPNRRYCTNKSGNGDLVKEESRAWPANNHEQVVRATHWGFTMRTLQLSWLLHSLLKSDHFISGCRGLDECLKQTHPPDIVWVAALVPSYGTLQHWCRSVRGTFSHKYLTQRGKASNTIEMKGRTLCVLLSQEARMTKSKQVVRDEGQVIVDL